MDPEKELMGAATAVLVLAEIQRDPTYGYDLLKRMNAAGEGKFTWHEGTLYPILHRLELDGLLRSQWQQSADTARKRKHYTITPKGRQKLAQGATQWNQFHTLVTRLTGGLHATPTLT